ncbi:MAG TPA: 50S ribosomal protein L7ae-like protein [Firmicutes bacterium]|nr:50S ribosomal protein L7ae-like protein [Bacillota bacterium]
MIASSKAKVVGYKQTLRALKQDQAARVLLAADAEEDLVQQITEVCQEKGLSIEKTTFSQSDLGKLCKIEVGASVVTLLREPGQSTPDQQCLPGRRCSNHADH